MTDKQKAWIQTIAGFAILILGVFLTSGLVEIVLAVVGVSLGAQGLQRLRQF